MTLKKMFLMCGVLAMVPTWSLAQTQDEEPVRSVMHDLTFYIGSLDLDEDVAHFTGIFNQLDSSATVLASQFALPQEAYRIAETMHLHKRFALDGALSYYRKGSITLNVADGNGDVENRVVRVSLAGFELAAMVKLPLFREKLVAYAKAGGSYSHTGYSLSARQDGSGHAVQNEENGAVVVGAGMYSLIRKKYTFRLDYVAGQADRLDFSSLSVGFGFRY